MNICAIILSAGKSKRFKSSKPKFLHEISGKELIQYNLDALNKIKQVKKTFIISSKANKKYFDEAKSATSLEDRVNISIRHTHRERHPEIHKRGAFKAYD